MENTILMYNNSLNFSLKQTVNNIKFETTTDKY